MALQSALQMLPKFIVNGETSFSRTAALFLEFALFAEKCPATIVNCGKSIERGKVGGTCDDSVAVWSCLVYRIEFRREWSSSLVSRISTEAIRDTLFGIGNRVVGRARYFRMAVNPVFSGPDPFSARFRTRQNREAGWWHGYRRRDWLVRQPQEQIIRAIFYFRPTSLPISAKSAPSIVVNSEYRVPYDTRW